ncbi:E3 ubiquitin-protein ligase rnf213-alpha-like isoform X1 [Sinocyclocheilus grahami]|uniref:E3 ubiquitin-protein ligase rnf213-alpha-like isoform X1 n=1 Tax=Sinocyclocheilus grahami TaxID=75366 RepID=UPI0007AD0319|nr:PREDICTED: E3 ubiquitin-protein ligase rnf213-alpha-like isoform X1 [Sinocyclocheilus grahami]
MKCPQCSFVSLEKAPIFCSQCGCKLTCQSNETAADKPQDKFQTSSNIPHGTDAEMTDIGRESEALDYQNANISPKRQNEDIIPNPKKKKRKKKKKKAGVAEGHSSLTSDLSDISLTEKEKKMEEDQSSDSDGSYCTVDDMPKPAESSSHLSPTETAELKQQAVSALPIDAAVSHSDEQPNSSKESCVVPEMTETSKLQLTQELISISTDKASPAVTMEANEKDEDKVKSKNKGQKSVSKRKQTTLDRDGDMDQNANIKSSTGNQRETDDHDVGAQNNHSSSGDTSVKVEQSQKQQSACADQKNTASEKQNKSEEAETSEGIQHVSSPKTKKNQNQEPQNSSQVMVFGPQNKSKKNHDSSADSSVKVEQSQKQQSAHAGQKNTASEKQNKSEEAETSKAIQHVSSPKTKRNQNQEPQNSSQVVVFGPQNKSKKNHISSGDSPLNAEHGPKQQQSKHGKKDSAMDQKRKESDDTESQCVTLPKRNPASNQHISSSDKLTIYFHAVLSKHFKFKPEEDYIFIRAGSHIGNWEKDLIELFVTRDLGEHGFLVEGKFVCKRADAASVSIPYKYVVYKAKKQKYELHYEYIYKLDSDETTNRCLFVKSHLLNDEGEWHQYDDIICAEPSNNMFEWIRKAVWPDHKKGVLQGRQIAGTVMLGSIFDLLRSWSKMNLSSFFSQLRQFFEVYGNPFVFEKTHTKWYSLDYSEKDVRKLLKQFMLERVTPELQKDNEEKSEFIKEPLKAGLIMLYVWQQYRLELDKGTLSRLCTALCLPKLPKDKFLSFWTDITESFSAIENLSDMVKELINRVRAEDMSKWVIVIPLLHLLKGTSKPFEPVSSKVNTQYDMSWAGLQGLKSANITSTRSQDRRAMLNLMKTHGHLVEVDKLLARSWMYLMTVEELVECSSIIQAELLDILQLFTMKCPNDITFLTSTSVAEILAHIQSYLFEKKYSCPNEDYGIQCIQATCKLLQKICNLVHYYSYGRNFTDIPVGCMNLVASVSGFAQTSQQADAFSEKILALLNEAKQTVRAWSTQTLKGRLLNRSYVTGASFTTEIEIWNNIVAIDFMSKDFTKEWRETFTTDFEGKYQQEDQLDQIQVYCSKIEELNGSHPYLVGSVEKCALQAVTTICQTKSEGKLFEKLNEYRINWKFGKLVSTIILKSWPKDDKGTYLEEEEVVLKHLLGWTAAKNIFQLHGADEKLIDQLSDEAREKFAMATSLFSNILNQVVTGKIAIKLLNHILQKRSAFFELLNLDCFCEDEKYKDTIAMRRLLQSRQEEVKSINHERALVDALITMSRNLQEHVMVDFEGLEEKQNIDIDEMDLDKFMEIRSINQIPSEMSGVVTYFELEDDVRSMAEVLNRYKDSYIFKSCWVKQAAVFAKNSKDDGIISSEEELDITLEDLHSEIFEPCYDAYKNIYTRLKDGRITFEEVDVTFKAYKGKYDELEAEVAIICKLDHNDDQCWVQTRIQQIEQYHELHLAVESAQVVMMVKQTLGLQGDFQVLEKLLVTTHLEFKQERLDSIDNELMQAKTVLVDITESRRLCLRELGLRKNFVIWVKEALEDINELKVFVDLASISAGENDLDVDRVACFHDAVLGYSSMLYDMKPDAGFKHFKEMLKKLWKALDNDPNLPKKLCDSARHIEWLKTVKDSHGSVELSSLSLASAINTKGIYIISAQNQKKLCLENILKLHIMEEHDEGCERRIYSLEDLRDLQNKLMLMSGKGDQGQCEVDQFAEVFASVQRLGSVFIDLFVAGNPLFRHWEANINCNSKEACIILDFNLGNVVSVVMVEGDVTEQLPEVCKKMESCLCFWKDFMDKQRSQHYYLNYYTAEQVVYLCHQLAQGNVAAMEDQVLMMLSFIKSNCTTSDLRQAWHRLQYEVIKKVPEQNDDLDFQTFMEVPSMMENESIEKPCPLIDDLASQLEDAIGSKKLGVIWNAYMRNMNNFLPDSLDVRRLGYLLEILANSPSEHKADSSQDDRTKYIQRELPNGMATGKPNLIICPSEEILISCISIYMSSKGQPLPTYDEVLLCSAFTSYEEVELFLRRCLSAGYKGKKIYTMLYVDQLTYEVSYKVEQFFQHQSARSRNDYRLVLVCSSNREHAYLPSAFSQFRLHLIPQEPIVSIQQYLVRHFTVPADISSAAAMFKDRQCVGVVSSERSGVGKSLYIKRMYENLKITKKPSQLKCIRLIEPRVDENVIIQSLLNSPKKKLSVYHFDVTTMVKKGLHEFLFRLLILGYLMDSEGNMWKSSNEHLYVIEILRPGTSRNDRRAGAKVSSAFLDVFPSVYCRPPKEVLELEMRIQEDPSLEQGDDPLMDDQEFKSEAYQRPYQYLHRFYNGVNLDAFMYQGIEGTHVECLQMLFVYCGIVDPSWAELRNFTWFLNLQLRDCERSVFCDVSFIGDTLLGFKNFVVNFMILMAKDFATPSLSISDQSPGRLHNDLSSTNEEDLAPFRIRKRWESEPHPYIFFNDDHESMTFIGFHLQPNAQNGIDAIDPSTNRVIKQNIMTRELYEGLKLQRVPFNVDFDQLPRWEKIERLSRVLGIQWPLDPDETYELTTDNILKMLAIHMRLRCGIPVIIMGETGCGKTRLIKFLCEMHRSGVATDNMKLVKVHGGTSSDMIYTKVREAEAMALRNKLDYGFGTVLFFDEANTTEAISSIKEILCDNTAEGEDLTGDTGLQIIAACNPYRKHTDVMIKRLESAGLGYRVRAEETDEKLGSIPLRQLVYRVQALPPSMIPLVWDFGQLNDHTEKMYIKQIVERVAETHSIDSDYVTTITDVLSASQKYMRTRQDECSFVSLRDVERCMQVLGWFYKNLPMLLSELAQFESNQRAERNCQHQRDIDERNPILWSLIMAVGVCYHACLEDKEKYRKKICGYLPKTYSPMKVMQEISVIQGLFLSGVPLGETIARNNALKENVFMMVICIELRIPLFLVGKPGSSKSLSKTLVADGMQGQAAHSDLFRKLKQIHLVSFQCSPHSTPDGIINTFKQCARFQEGKNLSEYVSVVVLDEIGLAEDSQKMPLKTLHPLLEEGCIDDQPVPHKKVGFVGISNWALDPAKMNRGIFVSRGDPDEKELIESAKGICSSDAMILERVRDYFQPFARAYLNICKKQGKGFFGLRDYYSLIKMMFTVAKANDQKPTAEQIVRAVLRNFSGKDNVDAVTVFTSRLNIKPRLEAISAIELVRENIAAIGQDEECRYLLVLTKNYAALQILQQTFFSDQYQPEIIFGSSFPKDQEYTQICRNINRVKICMETGQTVVLLNLQNLYESLYDALNQYYVSLGGQKYVDLGLGTHRVKCRVHKDFRLIVIEEKDIVYKQFPIPLINRLEKHYLDLNTVLKSEQKDLVEKLEQWVQSFISARGKHSIAPQARRYFPADAFIGYHSDTCASVVLQVTEHIKGQELSDPRKVILDEAKLILLNCATPDAVVRLDCTSLSNVESDHFSRVYFEDQKHSSLADFILSHLQQAGPSHAFFTEVTTFSRLLTAAETEQLQNVVQNIELLSLQQFDTEHSFLKKIKNYLENTTGDKILIIQSDFDEGSPRLNVIASAKYSSINEINKFRKEDNQKVFVYFITKLPRMDGGTSYIGFNGGPWKSVHIDDLRRSKDFVFDIKALQCLTISQLFEEKADEPEAMEVDDMYTEEEKMELEDNTGWKNVLDTTALVRSCVQSAVGMLRDQTETSTRSTKRVEILLMLLADNKTVHAEFLKTLKKRLHFLLMTHDENTISAKSWVSKEALNTDALQEGGTFRHALWRRVQAVVTPFLAQLVSIIDRDCNLDLLLDRNSEESLKKLWLDIFGDFKLLNVPYTRVENNSETKTILVQNHIAVDRNIGCTLPFSWRIKDCLEEVWVHALQREGHSIKQFEEFFWKTPLGRCISEATQEMQMEFFHRYLQDFISMTMNVTSEVDLKLLRGTLTCGVHELRGGQEAHETEVISLAWVHAAYHHFKNRIQNLYRMISIEPQIAHMLIDNRCAREGTELVLDMYAAVACIEYLEPQTLDGDVQSLTWLRRVKKLQVPIELVCCEEGLRHYGEKSKQMVTHIQHGWRRICSLALFVEHMLLGVGDVRLKLRPLVLEHTRRLAQVLERDSNLKKRQPFEAVITILKACKDGASQTIFRFGIQPCPVCMGDPQDPLSLPCDHIYCLTCIKQWLGPGQMHCPLCVQEVPDGFVLKASDEIRDLISQNALFRMRCNAFFIDLVTTVCFKDNTPPSRDIILHLLSLLMVESRSLPQIKGRDRRFLTKALSPFDDSVDKNPVVRSVVLKLLLKYSFDDVKHYLQQHLTEVEQSNIIEETDKTELYSLYINCLEDSMYDRTQWHSVAEQQACLQEETRFLLEFLHSDAVSAHTASIEHLQRVARVRLCLDMAADLLVNRVTSAGAHDDPSAFIPSFLDSVVSLCCQIRNDWYRVYLIRKICSLHGVEYVQKLLTQEGFKWLFPQEILESNQDDSQIDQYLACGMDYKTVRDAVAKAMLDCNMNAIQKAIEKDCNCTPMKKAVYLLLALFREVTALYRSGNPNMHPKPEQCAGLEDFIRSSEVFVNNEMRAFAQALVKNDLHALRVQPQTSGREFVLVEVTVHMAAVLLCGNLPLLKPLQQLALSPNNMMASFIPTMPDDMLAVAKQALGQLQWYFCPNGHPCTVGECGQPMEVGRCPDCHAPIGGINHNPVQGFQTMQIQGDRTQSGHILGDAQRRDQPDMQDTKNMSPAPFALLRLLTHMSMLLGAQNNPQSVRQIIKPAVLDPGPFLMTHLLKDMEQLSRALGKGLDDTVCSIHLTIHRLLDPHQTSQWPVTYDPNLSTKDARNGWENAMNTDVITHQLKVLEHQLKEVNAFIRKDERVSSNPVMKLTFGEPGLFLRSLPQNSLIHNSSIWSCRRKVSTLSLTHIVEQNSGRDTLPVLWRFLQREAELRLVRFLPDILVLQRDLVKKFQNMTELNYNTIGEFLQNQKAASLTAWYEKRIKIFISTWNQIRVSLATTGEIKLPDDYTREDLGLDADMQVLLPQRSGLGLCSTALVSYLITLHNDLIYTVEKYTREESGYTVSPGDLTEMHVIRYEYERDVLPLVLSNCQYRMEHGQETLAEYDLPKIQQQILTRFLQGKPHITLNGIPTLVNRQDRNYEIIFKDVKGKVQQESLQPLTQYDLVKELQSYSDVCEALSTVELALGFLAMTGGEPHMQLSTYLKEVLQMTDHMAPHVFKALSRCSLKHCVALWQLLSSLKSETMLRLKRDPFVGISKEYRRPLQEEHKRLLTSFFTKSSADAFLLEMHEFLLLVLKNPKATDTFRPDWGLKDTVVSYMERKDLGIPPEVDEFFPEEILLSQYTDTWKFSVLLRQERNQI